MSDEEPSSDFDQEHSEGAGDQPENARISLQEQEYSPKVNGRLQRQHRGRRKC